MDKLLSYKESVSHVTRKTGNHVFDVERSGLLCSEIRLWGNNNSIDVGMGCSRYFLWFSMGRHSSTSGPFQPTLS